VTPLFWLRLESVPILTQLQLEEALLRTDLDNYVITNTGASPAIVVGCSQDPAMMIDLPLAKNNSIPVIRRASGGGTVIIDENSLLVSFICSKPAYSASFFPEPILRWSHSIYKKAWDIPGFLLQENDFTINGYKCAGNALCIQKNRFLHHASFLWDYDDVNMNYLRMPARQPAYRQNRPHHEFLCRMNRSFPNLNAMIQQLQSELVKQFYLYPFDMKKIPEILNRDHRKTATLLSG
jgi:lipoate-protein ligase A